MTTAAMSAMPDLLIMAELMDPGPSCTNATLTDDRSQMESDVMNSVSYLFIASQVIGIIVILSTLFNQERRAKRRRVQPPPAVIDVFKSRMESTIPAFDKNLQDKIRKGFQTTDTDSIIEEQVEAEPARNSSYQTHTMSITMGEDYSVSDDESLMKNPPRDENTLVLPLYHRHLWFQLGLKLLWILFLAIRLIVKPWIPVVDWGIHNKNCQDSPPLEPAITACTAVVMDGVVMFLAQDNVGRSSISHVSTFQIVWGCLAFAVAFTISEIHGSDTYEAYLDVIALRYTAMLGWNLAISLAFVFFQCKDQHCELKRICPCLKRKKKGPAFQDMVHQVRQAQQQDDRNKKEEDYKLMMSVPKELQQDIPALHKKITDLTEIVAALRIEPDENARHALWETENLLQLLTDYSIMIRGRKLRKQEERDKNKDRESATEGEVTLHGDTPQSGTINFMSPTSKPWDIVPPAEPAFNSRDTSSDWGGQLTRTAWIKLVVFNCIVSASVILLYMATFLGEQYHFELAIAILVVFIIQSVLYDPLLVYVMLQDSDFWRATWLGALTAFNNPMLYNPPAGGTSTSEPSASFGRRQISGQVTTGSDLTNGSDGVDLNNVVVDFEALDYKQPMGSGGFSTVYRGTLWKESPVAIKILNVKEMTKEVVERFIQEVGFSVRFRHPNLVQFIGACISPPEFAIIMELCQRHSLADRLKRYNKDVNKAKAAERQTERQDKKAEKRRNSEKEHLPIPRSHRADTFGSFSSPPVPATSDGLYTLLEAIDIALGIAAGMKYMHDMEVIHRDLKSSNVLFDASGRPKICDFGLSREGDKLDNSFAGTIAYMSPEMIKQEEITKCADVYSYAIILWELCTSKLAWTRPVRRPDGNIVPKTMDALEIMLRVANRERPPIDDKVHPVLHVLLRECWADDPFCRPTFAEITDRLKTFRESAHFQKFGSKKGSFAQERGSFSGKQ